MQILSTRFGEIEVDPDTVITFPEGLLGFDGCTRFKLFHEEGKPLIQWFQAVDDPDVHFSVADPSNFNVYFEIKLTDEECDLLQLERPEEIAIFMMLYKPNEAVQRPLIDPVLKDDIRANVGRPIVCNTRTRIAFQKTLDSVEKLTIIRDSALG